MYWRGMTSEEVLFARYRVEQPNLSVIQLQQQTSLQPQPQQLLPVGNQVSVQQDIQDNPEDKQAEEENNGAEPKKSHPGLNILISEQLKAYQNQIAKYSGSASTTPSENRNSSADAVSPTIQPNSSSVPSTQAVEAIKFNEHFPCSKFIPTIDFPDDYWHKFIVLDGAMYEKTVVLKTVLNFNYPTEFIPVLYQLEGPNATFLGQQCSRAIKKIFQYRFKLKLDGYSNPEKWISLEIICYFSRVSELNVPVNDYLAKSISKRFNEDTGTLDLSNFSEDPDFGRLFYSPLWLSTVFNFVLVQAKLIGKYIRNLNLAENDLPSLKIKIMRMSFPVLKMIDLSKNEIDSVRTLKTNINAKLSELVLKENPVCEKYSSAKVYVSEIRKIMPNLRKLDGVLLCAEDMPVWNQNYIMTPEAVDFVNQFLERYFTIFDGEFRQWLEGMYHEKACFSMSAHYLGGQSTSSTARLTRYALESRNFIKTSDYSKCKLLISHGHEAVLAALCRLPRTEHDPISFSVDLVRYVGELVVLTVSGVFREPSMIKRFFNRTFVLTRTDSSQYLICNDILYISNATTRQAQNSFLTRPSLNLTKVAMSAFETLAHTDHQKLIECMAIVTEMNPRWAKKCLQESKWKFREALEVFTELLKMDKIPPEAFMKG